MSSSVLIFSIPLLRMISPCFCVNPIAIAKLSLRHLFSDILQITYYFVNLRKIFGGFLEHDLTVFFCSLYKVCQACSGRISSGEEGKARFK